MVVPLRSQSSLAILPCLLGLLRAASRTARALRAPPATATFSIRNGRSASSHRAAFSGPVFRGCALRFAPCARHSSPSGLRCAQSALAALPPLSSAWSIRIVRKLTRGSPCFTGLIDGYCSHWLRRLFRPHWAYYGLFPPQAAAFVRPCANACAVFCVCGCPLGMSSTLQPFGPPGSHRSSIQHGRPTALTSSLVALPASLGLLRPVSRTARGLRAPLR